MSPSWNRRANIIFAGSALQIERCERLRSTPTATERLEVAPIQSGPPWRAALDRLAEVLATAAPAVACVQLSGRFCRFALLPWSRGLTREEETALARAVFGETYGEAALSWEIRVDNLKRGEVILACAVDSGLVTGLAGAFESSRWRLGALQPLLAVALARRDATGKVWNALVEPDWWSAVLTDGEAFLAVFSSPAQPAGLEALAMMFDNDNVRLAQKTRALRILPGSSLAQASCSIPGWTIEYDATTSGARAAA